MMEQTLVLELAQRRVSRYTDDDVLLRHAEATECRDCEEWLQKGIDALYWLQWAEKTLREADYEGLLEFSPVLQAAIRKMYVQWLASCSTARQWISKLETMGFVPENAGEFNNACEAAEELIQRSDLIQQATKSFLAISSQEDW